MLARAVLLRAGLPAAAVAALVIALLGAFPAPARANHLPGAIYDGTTTGGVPVVVVVNGDGSQVASFEWLELGAGGCGVSGNLRYGIPIDPLTHSFASTADSLTISGSFLAQGVAVGTMRYADQECDTGELPWFATRPYPAPIALSFDPPAISPGDSSTGTVTLEAPAPPGGVAIGLYSSNSFLVDVDYLVVVPEGALSATFQATAVAWTEGGTATIWASHPGGVVHADLSILKQRTLTVHTYGLGVVSGPGIECGMGSYDCVKTFDDGTLVTLTATPAIGWLEGWSGDCSGTGSCVVTMDADRSVAASFAGPPEMILSGDLAFGELPAGATSPAQSLVIRNVTFWTSKLVIEQPQFGGPAGADFAIASDGCGPYPRTLNQSQSCTLGITFTPSASGPRTAELVIGSNDSIPPPPVLLSGVGLPAPKPVFDPEGVTFEGVRVGTTSPAQSVTVENGGDAPLLVSERLLVGDHAGDFALAGGTCGEPSFSLAAGESCTLAVTFTPGAAGARHAGIRLMNNAPGSPHELALDGTGLTAPSVAFDPGALAFAATEVGATSAARSLAVENAGQAALTVSERALVGANAADFAVTGGSCGTPPFDLGGAESCTISVTFRPTATGARQAALRLTDDAPGSPHEVTLDGTGKSAEPADTNVIPTPLPPGGSVMPGAVDRLAPVASLALRPRQTIRTLRRKGLALTLKANEPATFLVQLRLDRKLARKLGLPRLVGRASVRLGRAGSKAVTVKLAGKARRKVATLRRLKLSVSVNARDAAGNVRALARTVTLPR